MTAIFLYGLSIGLFVGLLLATLTIVVALSMKTPIERTLKRVEAKTKKKGKILEPENEEITGWLKDLPSA